MLNKVHIHSETDKDISLVFAKSLNVQVFPCGRRRSELINNEKNDYYIPFDPEARLNTEFNNRRHVGINGFTPSFITGWDSNKKTFTFTIAGYSFAINEIGTNSKFEITDMNAFGNAIIDKLGQDFRNSTKIYANIKLEEVPLYKRDDDITVYNTWVLRNQSASDKALLTLDLAQSDQNIDVKDANNYYFSGLSFSVEPITGIQTKSVSDKFLPAKDDNPAQQEFSLCILVKDNDASTWQLCESSKLPKVEHGDEEDSVNVQHLNAESIRFKNRPIAVFDVNELPTDSGTVYQLHLYNASEEAT